MAASCYIRRELVPEDPVIAKKRPSRNAGASVLSNEMARTIHVYLSTTVAPKKSLPPWVAKPARGIKIVQQIATSSADSNFEESP